MSSNWKPNSTPRRKEERPASKTGGLLSSYTKQQEDPPSLAKRSASQQFVGPRAKPTVPLGQAVQEQSKPASPLPAAPPSGPLLAGQFKARTTPLPPSTLPATMTKNQPLPQAGAAASNSGRRSLGISSRVKRQGVFVNTFNLVRQWSGKMATLAGYLPQPPAPYMERYQTPATPM